MSELVWQEKFSVGVKAFDRDHMVLLDLINHLHDAYAADKGLEALGGAFEALMTYTKSHFRADEALMEHHGYPGLEEHRAAHHRMTREIAALRSRFLKTGDETVCLDVLGFLTTWWHFHILEMDKAYEDFFRSKNID